MAGRVQLHRLERGAAYLLIGGAVALLALSLVPPVRHPLGPATVSTKAGLGRGLTIVSIPPLGTVSAPTHRFPLDISVRLDDLDPAALADALVDAEARRALEDTIEAELRATATEGALWLLVGGLALGGLAGALIPRRSGASIVAGGLGGVLAVAGALVTAGLTYDLQAFRDPSFSGTLQRAPQVIETLNRGIDSLARLRSRYEAAAGRLTDLLELVAEPAEGPRVGTVAVLHVSDIHSNPLGVELAGQLARRFKVDAVLDTGDLTSFGAPIEARIGELIQGFDVPYLFVPGNHDSLLNRRALARRDNVVLLDDGDVYDLEGVEIMGFADPTFTASNEISTAEGNEIRLARAPEVAGRVRARRPDVLAVHDLRLASQAIGEVPLVLSGHTHKRLLEQRDGTWLLTVGSTGAAGLGSFIVEADLAYEAEVIYFRSGVPVAVDYVRFTGLGADFEISRTTLTPAKPQGRGLGSSGRL